MKKVIFIILSLVSFLAFNAYALETTLPEIRNKIFTESKNIKALLKDSNDPVLINSMFDSCVIAMTQLDAYFSLIGIFNTIKKDNLSETPLNYLINWLISTKETNELNIKSLNAPSKIIDPKTMSYTQTLIGHFTELNRRIDSELVKIQLIKKSLKAK